MEAVDTGGNDLSMLIVSQRDLLTNLINSFSATQSSLAGYILDPRTLHQHQSKIDIVLMMFVQILNLLQRLFSTLQELNPQINWFQLAVRKVIGTKRGIFYLNKLDYVSMAIVRILY